VPQTGSLAAWQLGSLAAWQSCRFLKRRYFVTEALPAVRPTANKNCSRVFHFAI